MAIIFISNVIKEGERSKHALEELIFEINAMKVYIHQLT